MNNRYMFLQHLLQQQDQPYVVLDPKGELKNVADSVDGKIIHLTSSGDGYFNPFNFEMADGKNSLLDQLDRVLRLCKSYPTKIVLDQKTFDYLVLEFRKRSVVGLKVNLKNEYVSMWGMKIEIDKQNDRRLDIEMDGQLYSFEELYIKYLQFMREE